MREQIELVKELISIAEENDLAELNIDFKDLKVQIKKEQQAVQQMMPQMMMSAAPASQSSGQQTPMAESPKKDAPPKGVPVKSPLSGVFYSSPKPSAPPFVNVGDQVDPGQTLCIVEAMKLMNEITAEIRGKISAICKENGEVANAEEPLFYIEPLE